MKKIVLSLSVLFLGLISTAQPNNKKKEKGNKAKASDLISTTKTESPEERIVKIATMEGRRIGPMHHFLVQSAGHWREEVKIWAENAKEPSISRWEREGNIVLEGRFLNSMIMGMIGNERYEAQSTLGYDNSSKKFMKTWIDNFGTSILVLEGTLDEKTNSIDFVGTTLDPVTHRSIRVHQIQRNPDPQNQSLEIFVETKEGKEVKTMEINSMRG
jgi:hypothetical protein